MGVELRLRKGGIIVFLGSRAQFLFQLTDVHLLQNLLIDLRPSMSLHCILLLLLRNYFGGLFALVGRLILHLLLSRFLCLRRGLWVFTGSFLEYNRLFFIFILLFAQPQYLFL